MKTPTADASSLSALESLIADALNHLKRLNYSARMVQRYRSAWRKFHRFTLDRAPAETFSTSLAQQFLRDCAIDEDVPNGQLRASQREVRRAMTVLTEYALHGSFYRRRRSKRFNLSSTMQGLLDGFEQFSRVHRGLASQTMRRRTEIIKGFLSFLEARGIATATDVDGAMISEFVASRTHLKPNSLAREISHLRGFLRYLCMEGHVLESLIEQVPRIRVRPDARIPSVWDPRDVDALLGAVDRGSPLGKRDYAILLLAARLGMRVGDIRSLKLENLHWHEAKIEFRQSKTGSPQSLPMTEEIGTALIDYLRHGRPCSRYREVFLKVHAPIEPFCADNTLHYVITTYRRRAGIALPTQKRCGLHSLRHTLASRLLEMNTPLQTIANVMGHLSTETTELYTKVGIDALRSAALDPEEVEHA